MNGEKLCERCDHKLDLHRWYKNEEPNECEGKIFYEGKQKRCGCRQFVE